MGAFGGRGGAPARGALLAGLVAAGVVALGGVAVADPADQNGSGHEHNGAPGHAGQATAHCDHPPIGLVGTPRCTSSRQGGRSSNARGGDGQNGTNGPNGKAGANGRNSDTRGATG